jgi:hypothetical protein
MGEPKCQLTDLNCQVSMVGMRENARLTGNRQACPVPARSSQL